MRDIDPTLISKVKEVEKIKKFWWYGVSYNDWDIPNKDWIQKTDSLPERTVRYLQMRQRLNYAQVQKIQMQMERDK